MRAETIAAIISAVGVSGIVAAIFNYFANKKKVGADATKIITEAAAGVVSSIREELNQVQRELRSREDWEDEVRELLREHSEWDNLAVHALNDIVPPLDIPDPPPLYPAKRARPS